MIKKIHAEIFRHKFHKFTRIKLVEICEICGKKKENHLYYIFINITKKKDLQSDFKLITRFFISIFYKLQRN